MISYDIMIHTCMIIYLFTCMILEKYIVVRVLERERYNIKTFPDNIPIYRSRYIYTDTHTHTHTPFSAYTSRYRATLKACVDFNSCKAFSNSFCTCFIFA